MRLQKVTPAQVKDTGLALTLALSVAAYFTRGNGWLAAAIVALLVAMTVPALYTPLAIAWFGLARLLSRVMSTLLLTVVFFLVVTPVGLARRLAGADPLMRRSWKKGSQSVFRVREHVWTSHDLERPY